MAEYVDDSGSYGKDALLSVGCTSDAANKKMTVDATGADTDFILPSDTDWLLIETFDVDSGTDNVGYTKWQSDITQIASDIVTAQAIADTEYTTYTLTATHYDASETGAEADVYRGDESTTAALAGADTGLAFTPSVSSWKITNTEIAPSGEVDIFNYMYDHQVDTPGSQTSTYEENGDTFSLAVTAAGDHDSRPYIRFYLSPSATNTQDYEVRFTASSLSGQAEMVAVSFEGGGSQALNQNVASGANAMSLTADVSSATFINMFFDGKDNGTWSFDAASVKVVEV